MYVDINTIYLCLAVTFGFAMAWGIGANDVSNAMGTSVGSKALTLKQALVVAAIFEFLGAFLAGSEVTSTIRKDIINPAVLTGSPDLFIIGMLASLLAAGLWLLLASTFGWPVSTTHTIVGAIIGFGIAVLGIDAIQWKQFYSIVAGWVCSPLLGAALAYTLFISTQRLIFDKENPIHAAKKVVPFYILTASWIVYMIVASKSYKLGYNLGLGISFLYATILSIITAVISKVIVNRLQLNPDDDLESHFTNVEKIFSILMIFTACAMAFAHGSNDVANAVGPVAAIVDAVKFGHIPQHAHVSKWILLMGGVGIIVGLATYGHKVMATVGIKITQLTPSRGFAATLAAATTVVLASSTGLPISTTHTLIGAILGVGLARGIHALNLTVIKRIFICWIVELPAGALMSVCLFNLIRYAIESYTGITVTVQG